MLLFIIYLFLRLFEIISCPKGKVNLRMVESRLLLIASFVYIVFYAIDLLGIC